MYGWKKNAGFLLVLLALCVVRFWIHDGQRFAPDYTRFAIVLEVVSLAFSFSIALLQFLYFRVRRTHLHLLVAIGFLGFFCIELYHQHNLVTAAIFANLSPVIAGVGRSRFSSHLFLASLLALSGWGEAADTIIRKATPFVRRALYLGCFLLFLAGLAFSFFVQLPLSYYQLLFFHRPQQFILVALFLIAFFRYASKGTWRRDPLEYGLILSLIVSAMAQLLFMIFFGRPFDRFFIAADLSQIMANLLIVGGVITAVYQSVSRQQKRGGISERDKKALRGEMAVYEQIRFEMHRQDAITSKIPEGTAVLDPNGRYLYVSDIYAQKTSSDPEEMVGDNWLTWIHPDDQRRAETIYQDLLTRGNAEEEVSGTRSNGLPFHKRLTMIDLFDAMGRPSTRYCLVKDITEKKQAVALLEKKVSDLAASHITLERRQKELMLLGDISELFHSSASLEDIRTVIYRHFPMIFPSTYGAIYLFNTQQDRLEIACEWGVSKTKPLSRGFIPGDCLAFRHQKSYCVKPSSKAPLCSHVETFLKPTLCFCAPISGRGTPLLGVLHVVQDIGDNVALEHDPHIQIVEETVRTLSAQLAVTISNFVTLSTHQEEATRDVLTGLHNRRYMEKALPNMLAQAGKQRYWVGVAMLDLDHYKQVNDTYGHGMGDAVLREVGALLRRRCRTDDLVCRYGGDEFVLVLPNIPVEQMKKRAEQLRQDAKMLKAEEGDRVASGLTFSIGVAVYPAQGKTMEILLKAADKALYTAKQQGRDRVVFSTGVDTLG